MKERREGRGKGREAEEEHLEEKQPDSPAVCNSLHVLQLHGRRGREGEKKRGGTGKKIT